MMRRRILTFVGMVMIICFLGLGATAKADTITFSGTGSGLSIPTTDPSKPIFDFLAKGTVVTPLGTFTLVEPGTVNFGLADANGFSPNKGTFTYTLPNGDSFTGTFVGTIAAPNQQGDTNFALTYTITGGTGIFAGATGTGTSVGPLNAISGVYTERLNVTITAPGLVAPVPEPATMFLLGTGLVGMTARLQRKRNRRAQEK